MPDKFKNAWALKEFLRANNPDEILSLSWEFRLKLMERVAKILSDLHRKNRAYGYGSLSSDNVLIQASDRYGLLSLATYPPVINLTEEKDVDVPSFSENEGELAKLDQLCMGVLILELLTQKPLNGKKLPQLVGLLRRKGLGNLEISLGEEDLKKISKIKEKQLHESEGLKQKAKEELLQREIIKEDLKRNDYDPEPQSRMEEAELFRNDMEQNNEVKERTPSGKTVTKIKSSRNGSVFLQIKNSNRMKKTQMMMNRFFKNAQISLKKIGQSLNKRRKEIQFPKWANFQKVHVPRLENPIDEEGRVSRNLIRENDIIERKVDEQLEQGKKTAKEGDMNDYVMSSIIKDEVKAYLNPKDKEGVLEKLKKPTWMLNLHELILQLLTSVDDSRPSSKATRNWLLEILGSFEQSAEKHENIKKVIDTPEFKSMSNSLRVVKLNISETMQRGDYLTNVYAYDLLYSGLPVEEIFADLKPINGEISIYHSKDVKGEILDYDDEDAMSVDSHQPPAKEESEYDELKPSEGVTKTPLRSSLLVMGEEPSGGSKRTTAPETEFVLEQEPPPIFGPNADKLLERMEKQRREVGEVLKPSRVAELFDEQKKMPHHQVVNLLKKARDILDREPNVLNIEAPVIVVGDIHGQYFDLRQVMKFCGKPKKSRPGSTRLGSSSMSFQRVSRSSLNKTRQRVSRKSKRASKAGYLTKLGLKKGRGSLTEKEKDKLVFNQEDLIKELRQEEDHIQKFSNPEIATGQAPIPHTKALTLGRTLEGGKVEGVRDTMASVMSSFRDSVSARHSKGMHKDKGKKFLFLGDYIDRGHWSCEVLFYLLSLKVHYPDSVIMLRGNHECDTMAETYGFREECEHKYGREVYHRCVQVFYSLPIACLVTLPNGKRFLGCHGGFSDKISNLEQLMKIERRREPGIEGVLCDLLWSDPVPDNVIQEYNLPIPFEQIDFIPNETRGCAKKFGYKALERFLVANDLVGVIRAHEAKEEGFQYHFQNAGTKNHICITVFSAPNYMNEHGNKGAVLLIHKSVKDRLLHQMKRLKYKYTVDQILKQQDKTKDEYLDVLEPICYNEVIQPDVVAMDNQNTNLVQQIEETCPYMPTIIDEFYNSSLDILERYGDAQQQLETYAEEQKQKKIEAEKELEETKKEKAKLKFQTQNGRRVWHSVKFGTNSFKKIKNLRGVSRTSMRSQRNTGSSSRFDKTMKKVNEQHPHLIKAKLMRASSRLEEMETKAIKAAQTDDDVFLNATSSRSLGVDNIQTVKRGRALSAGVTIEEHKEIMKSTRLSKRQTSHLDNEVSEAEEDNNVVVSQIQNRQFMKRERIEIDRKEDWLLLLSCWFSKLAGEEIFPENLFEECEDCVLLCQAAANVLKRPDLRFYRPKLNEELSSFQIRRNLIVFQDCCKDLGIQYMFLIYDLKNHEYNYVLPSLIQLAKLARKEKVIEYLFDPEFPEQLWSQEIGRGLNEIPDDAREEDLRDKGLEVGAVTFNGEERLMLQLLFLMIDIDDSGLLTAEGIIGWAREEGKLIRPEHASKVISAIDYDNDGAIGLRDFFQYAAKLKEEFLSEDFDEYEDEYEDEIEDGEEMLFENQQQMSGGFEGVNDDIFNPTDAFDLSKVQLQMETNSEDSDDIITAGI